MRQLVSEKVSYKFRPFKDGLLITEWKDISVPNGLISEIKNIFIPKDKLQELKRILDEIT